MITTPTVLVLGAGASVPYGFPSGLELLEQINGNLEYLNHSWWNIIERLEVTREEVSYFLQELLFSGQPSVDAFLEHRSEFLKVGKLVIALAIFRVFSPLLDGVCPQKVICVHNQWGQPRELELIFPYLKHFFLLLAMLGPKSL